MRLHLGLVVACPLAVFWACSADPPLNNETDGVITIKASHVDYSDYSSFVTHVALDELCVQSSTLPADPSSHKPKDPVCADIDHSTDRKIIERIQKNMRGLDLDQVDVDQADDADLYVVAGIVSRDYWDLSKKFCIDNGVINGCISPLTDHHIYAPIGSLVLALVDLNASKGSDLKTVWAANIDMRWAGDGTLGVPTSGAGGAGGSGNGGESSYKVDLQPWLKGVDQAYKQSPYLNTEAAQ